MKAWQDTLNAIDRLLGSVKDLRAEIESEANPNPQSTETFKVWNAVRKAEDMINSIIVAK